LKLGEVWSKLEESAPSERDGRMVQRIYPDSPVDVFATLELHGARKPRRALELQVRREVVDRVDPVSGTRQVDFAIVARDDAKSALVLALDDAGVGDLFAAMCSDVAEATAGTADDEEAVATWIGRFAKWRRMLQGGAEGLSARRQRGLFAELLTIREHLMPHAGFDEAVGAWKGPDGAPRDFELRGCGLEVKSSAANEPQVVPVHGERQLDGSGLVALLLIHRSLEVLRDAGETLPMIVADLRSSGSGRPEAGTFEDRLLQSGYLDMHEPRYRRTGYAIRRTSIFEVQPGFPRITEGDLVDGIGAVRYSLAIDACREFEVEESDLAARMASRGRQASEST
jgi:hypothetical protein